jgi:hypothetical protein
MSGASDASPPALQTCYLDGTGVVIGEPDPNCGKYGYGNPASISDQQIPRPADLALGASATLTARVGPESTCPDRKVLFEASETPGNWDHVGKSILVGDDCKAARAAKVTRKTKFRAVSINTENEATEATSTVVTVKLK